MLGIDKSELQQDVKYNKPVPTPYPDLEGNIIEGIDTGGYKKCELEKNYKWYILNIIDKGEVKNEKEKGL